MIDSSFLGVEKTAQFLAEAVRRNSGHEDWFMPVISEE